VLREAKSALIEVSHDARLGMTEMVLAAADTPGLLADVAGVLYANRIEGVDAAIYSRQPADPKESPEALDVFRAAYDPRDSGWASKRHPAASRSLNQRAPSSRDASSIQRTSHFSESSVWRFKASTMVGSCASGIPKRNDDGDDRLRRRRSVLHGVPQRASHAQAISTPSV
jgi:UTP:GlnB (protein PII) uridylyltransferase